MDLVPWGNHHDDRKSQDVEHDDTNRNRVNRARKILFWVFGFCGSGTGELHADEGEDSNLESGEEARDSVREEAAMVDQVGHSRNVAVWGLEARNNHHRADKDERGNSHQLDDCEPKFQLTKEADCHEI